MTPNNSTYFDAHLPGAAAAEKRDADLAGGIVFGETSSPSSKNFLHAGVLSAVIGRDDARFPKCADVIDFVMGEAELLKHLKEPQAHWWPLCGRVRENGRPLLIHFSVVEFGSLSKGISRLARAFPAARFLIDPFMPGKTSNWKAGVCLAEEPNIWITTRGLYGCEANWEKRADREAFHFVIGEVGAGRLLFASEMESLQTPPNEWLESIPFLDAAQRGLILRENAAEALQEIRSVKG